MSSRRMIYPYTMAAKIVQFPYKYYWENSWSFKHVIIAYFVCLPVFYKLEKLSYAPSNVERFNKSKQKDLEEYYEHQMHLL